MNAPDDLAPVIDIDVARKRRRLLLVMGARREIRERCRLHGLDPDGVARNFCREANMRPAGVADLADTDVLRLLAVVRDRCEGETRRLMGPGRSA